MIKRFEGWLAAHRKNPEPPPPPNTMFYMVWRMHVKYPVGERTPLFPLHQDPFVAISAMDFM